MLTQEQESAVSMCLDQSERIIGVTGAAGTGKTLVLGKAYTELRKSMPASAIVLCAPTGRAAKRIQELTGIHAVTIHRLLEFPTPNDPIDLTIKGREEEHIVVANANTDHEPRRSRSNPIIQKMVFVDESSMIGETLYHQLVNALPARGCIRFFGDNNQLPPVEDGRQPFMDVLADKPSITLTLNFRSDDEIVSNAQRILKGSIPQKNSRFEIVYTDKPLQELALFAKRDEFGIATNQIIMPTRTGKFGTQRMNTSLQLKFNPRGDSLRLSRFTPEEAPLLVRPHDKFLWIKNDYTLELFNGEIGMIDWINAEDGTLGIATPDRQVNVPARIKTYSPYLGHHINYDPRKQIELGYAITTHKSQGSEFDTVVYCMTRSASFLINRQNFYTGITRAKQRVIVIADRMAMSRAMMRRKHM